MQANNQYKCAVYLSLAVMMCALRLPSSSLVAEELERYVAIDNVCAWPNLTLLKDGSLIATIHNEPSHGRHEADVECWASTDGGRIWKLRGVPAPHEPGTIRMNVAAGLAHDGSLIVLSSGWGGRGLREKTLPVWVCRSTDGGTTWHHSVSVTLPPGVDNLIPYGDVQRLTGKTLAAPFYGSQKKRGQPALPPADRRGDSYLLFSQDDGLTWGDARVIGSDDYDETAVLRLRPNRWLAAARTYGDTHLDLFVSKDEGQTWVNSGPLTSASQHPGHLLSLADGRILLSYGVREPDHQGIAVRVSGDEGRTWTPAIWLVHLETTLDHSVPPLGRADGGYPSTVQLPDGTLVTAYYSKGIPQHQRYHMGVVRWAIEKLEPGFRY